MAALPRILPARGAQPTEETTIETNRGWAGGPLVAFDTETTGVDVETDRIVAAYLGDGSTSDLSWLVDPGIALPADATAIHGITTDEVRAHGRPAAEAIGEIVDALAHSPSEASERLVKLALDRGGDDNATAMVIRVREAGQRPETPQGWRRLFS